MNLDFRNTNSLWCSVLAGTLHRCGVRHAVVSPGSRSAPLVFAFASHPGIETIPILDERSAAFFALGLSKQTSSAQSAPASPVALVCTSGTAAANLFPAIIEARESAVPLIVITADRPPEMRECGSGQTIDQQKLYGSHVNWYHELAVPAPSLELLRYLRQTLAHACERATTPERGPVHLNAPFRDPLPPIKDDTALHLREKIDSAFFAHLEKTPPETPPGSSGAGDSPVSEKHLQAAPALAAAPATARAIIVAGPGATAADVAPLAAHSAMPVLADALSEMRHLADDGSMVRVAAYDAILRNGALARALAPELVLCIGGWPTGKSLRAWIEKHDPEIHMVAPAARNRDPLHGRTRRLQPARPGLATPAAAYRDVWRRAEAAARASLDASLDAIADTDLFEPCAAWLLAKHLPDATQLFVASSMPVRDAETFWPANNRGIRFHYNRGANGIDGTLSTALGVAHGNPRPVVLLTGDLSLLHDTNGFLSARRVNGSLTIVLVNNNGGGIFEHLPVAEFDPPFEEYFATPQNIDFAGLCATYGVEHLPVESWSRFVQLVATLPQRGVRVLEIRTDRKRDAARRKTLIEQAAAAAGA